MSYEQFIDEALGPETVVLNCNRLAMDFMKNNSHEVALGLLHKGNLLLQQHTELEAKDKLRAMTLNNLGCLYKRLHHYSKALTFLTEALECERTVGVENFTVAGTHLNICALQSLLNEHEKALAHALKALELLKSDPHLSDSKAVTLVIAFNNAAVEHEYLGQIAEATRTYYEGWEYAVEFLGRSHALSNTMLKACQLVTHPKMQSPGLPSEPPAILSTKKAHSRSFFTPMPKATHSKKNKFQPYLPRRLVPHRTGLSHPKRLQRDTLRPIWKPPGIAPLIDSSSNLLDLPHDALSQGFSTPDPALVSRRNSQRRKHSVEYDRKINILGDQLQVLTEKLDEFEDSYLPSNDFRESLAFFSKRRQAAALMIQRVFRGYKATQQFRAQRNLAVQMQKHFRGWKDRRQHKLLYSAMAIIATMIQRRFRTYDARLTVRTTLCCTRIQQAFKGWTIRKINTEQLAAKKISIILKTSIAKRTRLQIVHKLVRVQAALRRAFAKDVFSEEHKVRSQGSLAVQAYWRGNAGRLQFLKFRQHLDIQCLLIQVCLKRLIAQSTVAAHKHLLTSTQLSISKLYRMHRTRQETKRFLIQVNAYCCIIQAKHRSILARDFTTAYRDTRTQASVKIQSRARGIFTRQAVAQLRARIQKHCTVIQAVLRRFKAKDEYDAIRSVKSYLALRIQTHFRQKIAIQKMQSVRTQVHNNSLLIQVAFRSSCARDTVELYRKMKRIASMKVQKAYRGFKGRRVTNLYGYRLHKDTTLIQRGFRRFLACRSYRAFRYHRDAAAIEIQKSVKGFLWRSRFVKQRAAAQCIQRYYRGFRARHAYEQYRQMLDDLFLQKHMTLDIESSIESETVKPLTAHNPTPVPQPVKQKGVDIVKKGIIKKPLRQRHTILEQIVFIQAHIRGFLARRLRRKTEACSVIQRNVKPFLFRRRLFKSRAVKLIQTQFRGFLILQQYQHRNLWQAVIRIQTAFRAFLVQEGVWPTPSTVKIQASLRRLFAQDTVARLRKLAVARAVIQTFCIEQTVKKQRAVTRIQATFRTFYEQRRFARYRSVKKIQCSFRAFLSKNYFEQSKAMTHLRQKVNQYVRIKSTRRYVAARFIQAFVRGYLTRRRLEKQHNAATLIASTYRMHAVRRVFVAVKTAAVQIQRAFRRAPRPSPVQLTEDGAPRFVSHKNWYIKS